jgi:hypothetical protein
VQAAHTPLHIHLRALLFSFAGRMALPGAIPGRIGYASLNTLLTTTEATYRGWASL